MLLNYYIGRIVLVRCVLEFRCGWVGVVSVLQASACNTGTTPTEPHRNSNPTGERTPREIIWIETNYGSVESLFRSHRSPGLVFPKHFCSRNPFGFERERRSTRWLETAETDTWDPWTKRKARTEYWRKTERNPSGPKRFTDTRIPCPDPIGLSVVQKFLLAEPFWLRKNNHGSSHPWSRKYRLTVW